MSNAIATTSAPDELGRCLMGHRASSKRSNVSNAGAKAMRSLPRMALVLLSCGMACEASLATPVETLWACDILDPEVHDAFDYLIYQRFGPDGKHIARMMRLDPATGAPLLNTDGVLTLDVLPYQQSQAGPKFANGTVATVPETYVAYSKVTDTGAKVVGARKRNGNAPGCDDLLNSPTACFPSTAALTGQIPWTPQHEFDNRGIVYTTEDEDLQVPAQTVYHHIPSGSVAWAELVDSLNGQTAPETIYDNDDIPIEWARIHRRKMGALPDELNIATVFVPAGFTHPQIYLIDEAGDEHLITTTAGQKFNPYLFQNAEDGANMIVYRESPNIFFSDIVVMREDGNGTNDWEEYLRITAEDIGEWTGGSTGGLRYLLSPETFDYDGSTYILFSSSNTQNLPMQDDGNIWVARVTSNGTVDAEMINVSTDDRPRVEAEVYYLTSGEPVFFYMWRVMEPGQGPPPNGCTPTGVFLRDNALASVTGAVLPEPL